MTYLALVPWNVPDFRVDDHPEKLRELKQIGGLRVHPKALPRLRGQALACSACDARRAHYALANEEFGERHNSRIGVGAPRSKSCLTLPGNRTLARDPVSLTWKWSDEAMGVRAVHPRRAGPGKLPGPCLLSGQLLGWKQ